MSAETPLRKIFNEALDRTDPAERALYLDEACNGDPRLRQRVEKLLRAHESAGGFMSDGGALQQASLFASNDRSPALSEKPGDAIGRYKLLQRIGEGGCGVVYMAEQEEPVRRRVALKILKPGLDTRQVVARFEAERQALALMDHPNIATVFDGGATATGRPYFVMELVRGVKITTYCDQNSLTTQQRLDVFVQVCHAIQHAHQKGVIHRDIKPSNILVTLHDGIAVPKVIDFGIAKATGPQRLTDKTLFTAFEQFMGTPAYMSPEQAEMSGLDIDTRSDIYALGVLLYELLTGKTPFDTRELLASGLDEMRRTIREREPERPSTRLSTMLENELTTTAKRPQTDAPKLIHTIRGDLDWIVMKCLEKDRTRRYDTANALALDVERHLNDEAVSARPPTTLYRVQKIVRRNKLAFAAATAVTVALLIGLVLSTWLLFRERAAHQRAEANQKRAAAEAARSAQVAQFMKDMLNGVGPSVALGRDTTLLREILDKTAGRLGTELKNQPAIEAELRTTIGQVYRVLGEYNKAERMHRESLGIRQQLHGANSVEVAESLDAVADVLRYQAKHAEAVSLLRESLAILRRLFGDTHSSVTGALYHLSLASSTGVGAAEVEALLREGLERHRKVFGEEHWQIAVLLHALATVRHAQGDFGEAENFGRQSLALKKKLFGENHYSVFLTLSTVCSVVMAQNKLSEAETLYRELADQARRLQGDDHPDVADCLQGLGEALLGQGKWSEGESVYRQAPIIFRKFYGDAHPYVAKSLHRFGIILQINMKYAEAESVLREAVAVRRRVLTKDHPASYEEVHKLASRLEHDDEGGPMYDQTVTTRTRLAANEEMLALTIRGLALVLRTQGKWEEAKRVNLEAAQFGQVDAMNSAAWYLATCVDTNVQEGDAAVKLAEKAVAATDRKSPGVLDTLAVAYAVKGRFGDAVTVQQQAVVLVENEKEKEGYQGRLRLFQSGFPYLEYWRMGAWLRDQDKLAEAESMYREELAMRRKMYDGQNVNVTSALHDLALVLRDQGQLAEAEALARESLAIREKELPDDWRTFQARSLLGSILMGQKQYASAEPLLLSGYEGLKQRQTNIRPSRRRRCLAESVQHLVQLYEAAGSSEKAAEWKKRLALFDTVEGETRLPATARSKD